MNIGRMSAPRSFFTAALVAAGLLAVNVQPAFSQTKKSTPPPKVVGPKPVPPKPTVAQTAPPTVGQKKSETTGKTGDHPISDGKGEHSTTDKTGTRSTTGESQKSDAKPTHRPDGGVRNVDRGPLAHAGAKNSVDHVGPHGEAVRMRANGRPADVHSAGMDIHHNLGGGRRVEMERADHSRLYYERGRPGYISHPYAFRGHDYYRRTYYYNGRAYDRFYNHYGFRGADLDVYSPARFYGAGFYSWAYAPWGKSVSYAWGFAAHPWYGYYGTYFTPYQTYTSPSLWLTDYLISTDLAAAYQASAEAKAPAEAAGTALPAPLTPETKQKIADEVRREVALENAEAADQTKGPVSDAASSSIAKLLSDGQPHVFVAGKEYDLTDGAGQECAVTDGDVLQLTGAPAADAKAATLTVLSSKGGVECGSHDTVSVAFEDLQDMQNHMRETIDQGLQELQAKQGQGGLPPAPASALAPPTTAPVAQNAPQPDQAGAQELAQQAQQSEQAERQTIAATGAGGA